MTDRDFPEIAIRCAGKVTNAMKITCACCASVAYFPQQSVTSRYVPSRAIQHFQTKGWVVGSSPKEDFCPKHASPSKRKGATIMAKNTAPVADKPRDMSREDRAIIFDKLNEVYGKDAYKAPWTDSMVAKDLGVPRDWVSVTRDAMFGPAGSNPLFDDFLLESARLESQFRTYASACEAATQAVDAQKAAQAALSKQMDAYRALARKVEREIGR
ncbi:hypothetical protein ACQZ4O_09225 [Agrobacterium vitis]|uniref:hypothetical protein n=1 Tax=Rhizobium/Agrobacterium group TaxID=227290 RepID=UPI0018D235A9|nr:MULTISPECIES: hypothetical protein [Rhizobium/Agrobacterium group]